MLADALLDPSSRGDIVIDPFLGSGSTLIAADKIGHVSRGVDLDSLYVDVIIRQYAAAAGNSYRDRRGVRRTGASGSREAAPN
jgi:DNA modification methylase